MITTPTIEHDERICACAIDPMACRCDCGVCRDMFWDVANSEDDPAYAYCADCGCESCPADNCWCDEVDGCYACGCMP